VFRALIFTILFFTVPLAWGDPRTGNRTGSRNNNSGNNIEGNFNRGAELDALDRDRTFQTEIAGKIDANRAEFIGKLQQVQKTWPAEAVVGIADEETKFMAGQVAGLIANVRQTGKTAKDPGENAVDVFKIGKPGAAPAEVARDVMAYLGLANSGSRRAEEVTLAIQNYVTGVKLENSIPLTPIFASDEEKVGNEMKPKPFVLRTEEPTFVSQLAEKFNVLTAGSADGISRLIVSSAQPVPVVGPPDSQGATPVSADTSTDTGGNRHGAGTPVVARPVGEPLPLVKPSKLLAAEAEVSRFLTGKITEVQTALEEFEKREASLKNAAENGNTAGGDSGGEQSPSDGGGGGGAPPGGEGGGGGGNAGPTLGGVPPTEVTMGPLGISQSNPDSNAVAGSGSRGALGGFVSDKAHPLKGAGFQAAPPQVQNTKGDPGNGTVDPSTKPFSGNSSPGSGASASSPGAAPAEGGGAAPGAPGIGASAPSGGLGDIAPVGGDSPGSDGLGPNAVVSVAYQTESGGSGTEATMANAVKAGEAAAGFAGAVWNQLSSAPLGRAMAGAVAGQGLMLFVGGLVDKTCMDPKLRYEPFCVTAMAKQPAKRTPASLGGATVKGKL